MNSNIGNINKIIKNTNITAEIIKPDQTIRTEWIEHIVCIALKNYHIPSAGQSIGLQMDLNDFNILNISDDGDNESDVIFIGSEDSDVVVYQTILSM